MGVVEILTPIAAGVGAFVWLPQIVKCCGKQKVSGKIISRYHMLKEGKSIFLFRIAILIRNKSFNLKCSSSAKMGIGIGKI